MSSSPLVLTFAGRGTATVVESDGTLVVLDATFSSPPGSPIEGTAEGASYKVKVRSSRRQPGDAPRFFIEGRFVDLTRQQRERVVLERQG